MYKVIGCLTALSVALTCLAAAKNAVHVPLPLSNPLKAAEQEKLNSKPANVLFAEKELPSLGKAMAIGYYPRGAVSDLVFDRGPASDRGLASVSAKVSGVVKGASVFGGKMALSN
jgi:hypothetical protein